MIVKVIGKYGRYAPVNEATNCYLLQTNQGKNILLDFGSGSLSLLQNHINIENIDMVILTHLHFDHSVDMGVLSYALGFLKLPKLPVYMPETPEAMKNVFATSQFDIKYIKDNMTIEIDDLRMTFKKSVHPVETYSVLINENSKLLVYTSDCSDKEVLKNNTIGANVVIGDACILDKNYNSNAPHISVKMLAENVPANCKLYLAHLTAGEEEDILDEGKAYHSNCELVKDFEF